MDPPNLTPVARYAERDAVLREMFSRNCAAASGWYT